MSSSAAWWFDKKEKGPESGDAFRALNCEKVVRA
jgi:hypothetical protein